MSPFRKLVGLGPGAVAPRVSSGADPSLEIKAGLAIMIAFFVLLLGWAALAPLNAAIVANGTVVVSGNRQTVQHRDGGVVSRLAVREGERVRRGDVLIELGAPELIAEERALLSQVLDLQARAARLSVETGEARELTAPAEWAALSEGDRVMADAALARHARGRARPSSEASARIVGYRAQIDAITEQEALVEQELEAMRPLRERGLVAVTRTNTLERTLSDYRGRMADLHAQIAATRENRIDELRTVRSELAESLPRLTGVRARLERTRLRAPSSGQVVGLAVHTIGGVIGPGERVLDIVPEGQDLIVEARVRPEDVDDLAPGQRAEVRITAFSGRNMPIVEGVVRQISADRFEDERSGDGYFVSHVAVSHDELDRLRASGRGRFLRPGLPAQVVVPTRERTALQYLTEPLVGMVWRSFREE